MRLNKDQLQVDVDIFSNQLPRQEEMIFASGKQ
jgi:hypothetical protein